MLARLQTAGVAKMFPVRAIFDEIPMAGVPPDEPDALEMLAVEFNSSRKPANHFYGCVGALDGLAIAIQKPPDEYVSRFFYCRKGIYALPVQAMVDARYRFIYMTSKCVGSTHDSIAFHVSALARKVRDGVLPCGYWIAADPAYMCSNGLMTPWPKSALRNPENGIYRDAFNCFQNSFRIHEEQAFGMLVRGRGILWRPLSYNIVESLPIVSVCMRLHSFAIDIFDSDSFLSFVSPLKSNVE